MQIVNYNMRVFNMEIGQDNQVRFRFRWNINCNLTTTLLIVALLVIGTLLGYLMHQNTHLQSSVSSESLSQVSPPNSTLDQLAMLNEYRREFIRNMTSDSFKLYRSYAWGNSTVAPLTNEPYNHSDLFGEGETILQSMSTLWVMGLKEQFDQAKSWTNESFPNLEQVNQNIELSKVVPVYLGSLLSSYALTNDNLFLTKAHQMAKILLPALNSSRGIPYRMFHPKSSTFFGGSMHLSEVNSHQLELRYLSDLTNNADQLNGYLQTVNKVVQESARKSPTGLLPSTFYQQASPPLMQSQFNNVSLFAQADQFYQILVKSRMQSPIREQASFETYLRMMDAAERVGMFHRTKTGWVYARDYDLKSGQHGEYMHSSGCYLGAMLTLGAKVMRSTSSTVNARKQDQLIHRHESLAEELTETCHAAANHTRTGLPVERIYFDGEGRLNVTHHFGAFDLGAQLAESYFVLFRQTHDQKYRDYAWELVQAIHRHCRTQSGGFTGLDNVNQIPSLRSNQQPSHFLSGTLKYLYLTFTDDTVLPLSQWVFNSAGHPLPICGENADSKC